MATEAPPIPVDLDSRSRALQLLEKIPDLDLRRACVSSLGTHATMNQMVKVFHQLYGLPILDPKDAKEFFGHISKERLAMRFGLIIEEFMELCEAMDIRADINFHYLDEDGLWTKAMSQLEVATADAGHDLDGTIIAGHKGEYTILLDHNRLADEQVHAIARQRAQDAIENTDERNMAEVADACFDLKYVIIGFEYEVGIEPQFCALEGHAANLSKLGADGKPIYREDGKVMKGPFYFKADMRKPLGAWGMQL